MPLVFRQKANTVQIGQYPYIFPRPQPPSPSIYGLLFNNYDLACQIGNYTVFSYMNTGLGAINNAIISTGNNNSTIYVLAVGGGGGGGNGGFYTPLSGALYYTGGGGGGAGGVVQSTITLNSADNITIAVGSGGGGGQSGNNTTVNFTNNANLNITAVGGGAGANGSAVFASGGNGGSGGGSNTAINGINYGGGSGTSGQGTAGSDGLLLSWTDVDTNSNTIQYYAGGGGGGAGGAGGSNNLNSAYQGFTTANKYNGGDGILCSLPGISNIYGNIYWGGGGAGGIPEGPNHDSPANIFSFGGCGGGGGGGTFEAGGNGDLSGVFFANNGGGAGGSGGLNTGGGGGGDGNSQGGGVGGSGIVLVATLSSNLSMYLPSYYFTYTGADQIITIPSGYTKALIKCWGAAGGTMGHTNKFTINTGGAGGGAYSTAIFDLFGFTTLKVIVGQGGVSANMGYKTLANYGGGGLGGTFGAGGGGRSAVQILDKGTYQEIITAGGGGGAGGIFMTGTTHTNVQDNPYVSSGSYLGTGGGGGTNAWNYNTNFNEGGFSGTGTSGGSGAITLSGNPSYPSVNGNNGSNFLGGSSVDYTSGGNLYGCSGGGGGGYYGGGSGGCYTTTTNDINNVPQTAYIYGGGGGGSSYVNYNYITKYTDNYQKIPMDAKIGFANGAVPNVANNGELPPYFQYLIGNGVDETDSYQTGVSGQHGFVSIYFFTPY